MELALNNLITEIKAPNTTNVKGKFIYVDGEKFYVKGVTYGPFETDDSGCSYNTPEIVKKDFEKIALHGFNSVRTYTVPPTWLLDIAESFGLKVMVGLPVEQNYAFLDDKSNIENIKKLIEDCVISCNGHSSILAYVIGNEIPASIVRWHGASKVERFLKEIYEIVKKEDNQALVTYVNYPTTEYLNLSFLDFICFNVYLENNKSFEDYIFHLQNLVGEMPLVMAEIGLDSLRNGEEKQARLLSDQTETIFLSGCAGLFIFSWTDEWNRGGVDITDWQFGLTTRERQPKKSLVTVSNKIAVMPFGNLAYNWPLVSVVLCTYNGGRTITESLEHLKSIDYPNYEVVIVNDGSNDNTVSILKMYSDSYGYKVINTGNRGLSYSRNLGIAASRGEIIAYIDDDAYPDPQWLYYLAISFMKNPDFAAVGGPNIVPPEDGMIAQCVANSPGGPAHVLISDKVAEHIAGCNMAFRREVLEELGGFDVQFHTAGDDVDVCWRIIKAGYKIGFSPSALVWHHRRSSIKKYWKQQYNYGRAEAMLLKKWHEKFNIMGHVNWSGIIYSKGLTRSLNSLRGIIYHGTWGTAAFQSIYSRKDSVLLSLFAIPEWYFVIILSLFLSAFSIFSNKFLVFIPVFGISVFFPVLNSVISARKTKLPHNQHIPSSDGFKIKCITALLHFTQPIARLLGRIRYGITPFRNFKSKYLSLPFRKSFNICNYQWKTTEQILNIFQNKLKSFKLPVKTGGTYDSWDFELITGLFGKSQLSVAIEEHGEGKQYLRFRTHPRLTTFGIVTNSLFTLSSISAVWFEMYDLMYLAFAFLILTISRTIYEFSASVGIIKSSVKELNSELNNETI